MQVVHVASARPALTGSAGGPAQILRVVDVPPQGGVPDHRQGQLDAPRLRVVPRPGARPVGEAETRCRGAERPMVPSSRRSGITTTGNGEPGGVCASCRSAWTTATRANPHRPSVATPPATASLAGGGSGRTSQSRLRARRATSSSVVMTTVGSPLPHGPRKSAIPRAKHRVLLVGQGSAETGLGLPEAHDRDEGSAGLLAGAGEAARRRSRHRHGPVVSAASVGARPVGGRGGTPVRPSPALIL